MKTYEITFITLEEPKDSSVKKDIETVGGKILKISSMGQKTFVYPIGKEKAGFYTTYLFEMEPEKLQDFNRKLAMEEEIIRHLIVSMKPSEIMAENSLEEKITSLEEKPETKLMVEPEMALEIEPINAIQSEPEKAIVEETTPTEVPVEIVTETVVEEKIAEKESFEKTQDKEKPAKKTVKKTVKTEEKAEAKEEKPKKATKEVKKEEPINDEEERLEALDKKLEELLKE
jgi:ribosomal protein S6